MDTPDKLPEPKRRPISRKVVQAIELMIGGKAKNITEAAAAIGMPRETLSRNLSRPDIAEQIRTNCTKALIMAAPRASAVKIDLMESDNAIVRERASSFVLGLIGIAPQQQATSVNLNLNLRAGFVIDLSEPEDAASGPQRPIVDITPSQAR
jgi:hypothetical protein